MVLAAASVLGTLGVLVVAGVGQYSSHSKTAEATRFLGAIEIGDRYSTVEVPPAAASAIIEALQSTRIKGRKVVVRLDRAK